MDIKIIEYKSKDAPHKRYGLEIEGDLLYVSGNATNDLHYIKEVDLERVPLKTRNMIIYRINIWHARKNIKG